MPAKWKAYRFKLFCAGTLLSVDIDVDKARFSILEGDDIPLNIYGRIVKITKEGILVELPRRLN